MIEKKVGNVTLKLEDKYIAVFIGNMPVRNVWLTDPIPDFGPEVVAAIEDLRKPLAENECWGPEGERLRFELRDNNGNGIAVLPKLGVVVAEHDILTPSDPLNVTRAALRIWAEKERARWTVEREEDRVRVKRDGSMSYGFYCSTGWCQDRAVPTFMRTKAQAEYDAMVRERKHEWTCSVWYDHGVRVSVKGAPISVVLDHEDLIEAQISQAPDDIKKHARRQIIENRPIVTDGSEARFNGGLWQVRADGMIRHVSPREDFDWATAHSVSMRVFRDAYLAKLKPKKPSERLGEALKDIVNPGESSMNELYRILDELAEKVGGL